MTGPLFDAAERAQLSDLLDELGPEAPTLLAPWTTRDMAAHLVLRERDPLAGPGLVLPGAWGRLAERRRRALALRDFAWLVATFRSGPPPGVFRSGWVRRLLSLNEFFVQHEDVRRANGRGPGRTSLSWTRPCGATSAARLGISRGDCAAQVLSFSGREPLRPSGPGGVNLPPLSPDLRASCCSTSSAGRARLMSR